MAALFDEVIEGYRITSVEIEADRDRAYYIAHEHLWIWNPMAIFSLSYAELARKETTERITGTIRDAARLAIATEQRVRMDTLMYSEFCVELKKSWGIARMIEDDPCPFLQEPPK